MTATEIATHLQSLVTRHDYLIDNDLCDSGNEDDVMCKIYDAVEEYDGMRPSATIPLTIGSAMIWTALARVATIYSFCPMHLCDIEICADDEIAECADLRRPRN